MSARILCLTACLLGLAAVPASASCLPSSERERLHRADAVFVGRVLSVSSDGATASFRVQRIRKGRVRKGSTVRVTAEPYPSSITIDWRPRVGQRWRVYAARDGRRWTTNDCMGTRRA